MSPEVGVWLTLDFAAKRYGVLPSQLLREGDTLDLECANIAVAYESYVHDNPGVKTNHGFSEKQLLEKLKRAKEKK